MSGSAARRATASDGASWLGPTPPRRGVAKRTRSLYLAMRDGVRIAVDVHLPGDIETNERLPTVVRQTRYFRGVALREPFKRLGMEFFLDHASHTRDRFVGAGYAWVDVCARGSGASFGHRPCPWSPDETADGREVVDWIVGQPWSNGRVGATGVSYDGTTADFLLVNQHPAVIAIAPRFSLWDVYTDVAFPGGIHLAWFTALWGEFNRALDGGRLDRAFALMIQLQLRGVLELPQPRWIRAGLGFADGDRGRKWAERLVRGVALGVRAVDDDLDRRELSDAIVSHADNFDVHAGALSIEHRDDAGVSSLYPEATIDFFSPHAYAERIAGSGAAVLGMSGWLDAGYQGAAVKRMHAIRTPGSKMILGPWDHGGLQNVSPFSGSGKSAFDQDGALIRFFDNHLRDGGNGAGDDPPVRYFTMGEERWKDAERWPPPGTKHERWYFADGRALARQPPKANGVDEYRIDHDVGTGHRSRWNSLFGMLPPVGYGDRQHLGRRLLVYRSEPLPRAIEVTGHPIVRLFLSLDGHDAGVFAYLEDEHPDGRVSYVTEGVLRALHRRASSAYEGAPPVRSFTRADVAPLQPGTVEELAFDLFPISWHFAAGHRVRLAIAGGDADHFKRIDGAATLAVRHGSTHLSCLELPVIEG